MPYLRRGRHTRCGVPAARQSCARRTVTPLRSVLAVQFLHGGCGRAGVPASAGSQQGPSGPRCPFSLEKRGRGNGAEAPGPLPPEGGTPTTVQRVLHQHQASVLHTRRPRRVPVLCPPFTAGSAPTAPHRRSGTKKAGAHRAPASTSQHFAANAAKSQSPRYLMVTSLPAAAER